jgi:transposase InsO family protein
MKSFEKEFPVDFMCEIFSVSRSGYYSWRERDNSAKEGKALRLLRAIEDVHKGSRETYGSPRVFRILKGLGHQIGKSTVERTMKRNGIRAKTKRKFRITTDSKHNLPVAPNLLKRNFSTIKPNQVWVSDLTYLSTKQGWLFLAVIIDLFSRQIVGWSLDKTMTKELVLSALRQAYFKRKPGTGLIFHSDRGSQYCSKEFRKQLKQYRMLQSQSRKGNCWDNAVVESFFHTLKTEAIFHEDFQTRAEAERMVFEWIEAFYNRDRIHSTLNYMAPVAFEEAVWR